MGLACRDGACRPQQMDAGTGVDASLPRLDGGGGGGGGDGGGGGGDGGGGGGGGDGGTGPGRDGAVGDGGMCIQPGQSCTQGASTCCGDYACGAQPGGTFCCRGQNAVCAASRDCCGAMLCTGGRCICRRREETCSNDNDCCGGARCQRPMGQTTGAGTCACSQSLESCTSSEGCCSGLECRGGRCLAPGCLAPGDQCNTMSSPDGGMCCGGFLCGAQPGGTNTCCRYPALTMTATAVSCTRGSDCCGQSTCSGGNCVCRRNGESCMNALECCGAMQCERPMGSTMGTCRCQQRGGFCLPGGNDCCAGTTCVSDMTGSTCR
jgi:hypothetical protein